MTFSLPSAWLALKVPIAHVADALDLLYRANSLEKCVGRLQHELMVHDKIGILYFSGQSGVQLCFPVRGQISLHAQRVQFTKCCYRRYGISLHQHEQLTHWCTVDWYKYCNSKLQQYSCLYLSNWRRYFNRTVLQYMEAMLFVCHLPYRCLERSSLHTVIF